MDDLTLTIACGDYDRTRPLLDGIERPDGISLQPTVAPVMGNLFRQQLATLAFDVSEMSMSNFISSVAAGSRELIGIPVFPARAFRHGALYVSRASTLSEPSDLSGKRVGVPDYTMTAAVYVRGLLRETYQVPPEDIDWYWGGLDRPSDSPQRLPVTMPPGLSLTHVDADTHLTALLVDGQLDAVISARLPAIWHEDPRPIRRLMSDYRAREVREYERSRIFPIMHTVVVRRRMYEKHPWVARSLYAAFCRAKEAAMRRLAETAAPSVTLAWAAAELEDEQDLLGKDPWPYGIAANRRAIALLIRYASEQGVCARPVGIEELFTEECLDT